MEQSIAVLNEVCKDAPRVWHSRSGMSAIREQYTI